MDKLNVQKQTELMPLYDKMAEYVRRFRASRKRLPSWNCSGRMQGIRKKYHEQKLLKKTDFLTWKKDQSQRELGVIRRYNIQNREDYQSYVL